jgi:hypothetical protein
MRSGTVFCNQFYLNDNLFLQSINHKNQTITTNTQQLKLVTKLINREINSVLNLKTDLSRKKSRFQRIRRNLKFKLVK